MTKLGRQSRRIRPEPLKHPEVRGVFIGGCVDRGVGSKFRAKAHAHISGMNVGWICFRSLRWYGCRELLLHELAHVVTKQGHTRRWREYLLQIGGTLDPVDTLDDDGKTVRVLRSYHPEKRPPMRVAAGGGT